MTHGPVDIYHRGAYIESGQPSKRYVIDDPRLLDLLWQYLRRTVYDDGLYEDIEQGISLGCPISPLMGALFLDRLDRRMEAKGLCYIRFMDDWVILAPSRWKLRRAVRLVQQTLDELNVETHPDKTSIGRIDRGFRFLGYDFDATGLVGVAPTTYERFVKRVNRLYPVSPCRRDCPYPAAMACRDRT